MEVEIIGCKKISNIEKCLEIAKKFSNERGIIVQLMDADMVYGKDHLISAVEHASRAFEEGRNSSSSLSMEILLYASGKKQIKNAIQFSGIKERKSAIAVIAGKKISKDVVKELMHRLNVERDDSVIQKKEKTLNKFGFSLEEIGATNKPEDLILEKVAMVDIMK